MMDRRAFLGTLIGGLLGEAISVDAQETARPYVIGYLGQGTRSEALGNPLPTLLANLRAFGYVAGQNLVVEARFAEGRPEDLSVLAAQLVSVNPRVIAEDSTSYGTPALKVRGKLFARLHQDGDCFVLRSSVLDRQILLQIDPEVFFITEHYRGYPWVLVRFSAVQRDLLPDLLERAWRMVAPKTLIEKHDQADDGKSAA